MITSLFEVLDWVKLLLRRHHIEMQADSIPARQARTAIQPNQTNGSGPTNSL